MVWKRIHQIWSMKKAKYRKKTLYAISLSKEIANIIMSWEVISLRKNILLKLTSYIIQLQEQREKRALVLETEWRVMLLTLMVMYRQAVENAEIRNASWIKING